MPLHDTRADLDDDLGAQRELGILSGQGSSSPAAGIWDFNILEDEATAFLKRVTDAEAAVEIAGHTSTSGLA